MARASVTKINTFKRCKRKYYYAYVLKLMRVIQNVKPARGKLIHACLQNLYSGKDPFEPINALSVDMSKIFDEERLMWETLQGDAVRIVRGYMNAYRETDSLIKTVATECHDVVPIGKHEFETKMDWLFEDAMGLWITDHKIVGSIPSDAMRFSDVQTSMYYVVAKLLGYDPVGVVFNYIKDKPPKVPSMNKDGSISKAAIDTDVPTYMTAVKQAGLDPDDYADMLPKLQDKVFYKRVRLPKPDKLVKNILQDTLVTLEDIENWESVTDERFYTRNIMAMRCEWDCEFHPLCAAELAGVDTGFMLANDYCARVKDDEVKEDAE